MSLKSNSTKHENAVLKMILEKSEDGKNMIKIRELITQFKSNKNENIKQLLNLFEAGKLSITNLRRDKDEPYLTYNHEEQIQRNSNNACIRKLIEIINFYTLLVDCPSFEQFHVLTENKFISNSVLNYIEKLGISYTETTILFNTIKGFISGLHPVHLNDMNLSAIDLAFYSEQFLNKRNILIQNELIKNQTESDGITCKVSITQRTLKLMQGLTNSLTIENKKKQNGLYVFRPFDSIHNTKMYYNSSENRLFENILSLLRKADNFSEKSITLLLHGPSGTGKTEFAFQLAKQINGDIMQFDFSQIQSKWIGETEKNIKIIFKEYEELLIQSKKPLILLMNEADGLMNRRVSVNTSNDIHSNLAQAQMLEMLEEFKGILVATTNMFQNIDIAFHRRFLFKYKIDLPDMVTKEKLINDSLIVKFISASIREKLLNSRWSPAQLRNLEKKIEQFELFKTMNDTLLVELLNEEGMLNNSKIGYLC
jgi:hypothetical protein